MTDQQHWRSRAACQQVDAMMFHPEGGAGAAAKAKLALHICHRHCPVLRECDKWQSRYQWNATVVGGRWWKSRHSAEMPAQVTRTTPSGVGCPLCWQATVERLAA